MSDFKIIKTYKYNIYQIKIFLKLISIVVFKQEDNKMIDLQYCYYSKDDEFTR